MYVYRSRKVIVLRAASSCASRGLTIRVIEPTRLSVGWSEPHE